MYSYCVVIIKKNPFSLEIFGQLKCGEESVCQQVEDGLSQTVTTHVIYYVSLLFTSAWIILIDVFLLDDSLDIPLCLGFLWRWYFCWWLLTQCCAWLLLISLVMDPKQHSVSLLWCRLLVSSVILGILWNHKRHISEMCNWPFPSFVNSHLPYLKWALLWWGNSPITGLDK